MIEVLVTMAITVVGLWGLIDVQGRLQGGSHTLDLIAAVQGFLGFRH